MGGHYGSVQLRTDDRARVLAAAEAVARAMNIKCLVGPAGNVWVGVYPEGDGQNPAVGEKLAAAVGGHALQLMVYDDDVLAYWLWRDGQLVDRYWSDPGGLDEKAAEEEEPLVGDPEQFRPIIGDECRHLAKLLDRRADHTFESRRLAKLATKLGITNAVTAFEMLEAGERSGVRGWRQFTAVPPRPVPARKPSAKAARARLAKPGVLLYADERKGHFDLGIGCASRDGLLLGWHEAREGTHQLGLHRPPWGESDVSPAEISGPARYVGSDPNGDVAFVVGGTSIRILAESKTIFELSGVENLWRAVVAPDRSTLAYAAGQEVVVLDVATRRRLYAISHRNPRTLAFHPSGKWVVASGDMLRLISLDGEPCETVLYVGGNAPVTIGNVRGIEEPGCIGFSRDGRLFWCGTNVGMRLYDWATMTSTSSWTRPKALWRLILRGELPSFWAKQVTAIAEEADGNGLVFGTHSGRLARLDLGNRQIQKLLDLPGGGKVEQLLLARDGSAVAVFSDFESRKGPRSVPKHAGVWEIFDYAKLRSTAAPVAVQIPEVPDYRRARAGSTHRGRVRRNRSSDG
jgi:hypothetical protein